MAFWNRSEPSADRTDYPYSVPETHEVLGTSMHPPFPDDTEHVSFGMGCFWGAERIFWQLPGVFTTAAGYQGGTTDYPTYREVCSADTGHAEVALVVYRPAEIPFEEILRHFWEQHDPTTLNRQGNDVGPQYRSVIFVTNDEQRRIAEASRNLYQAKLDEAGYGTITTVIEDFGPFFYAEDYHQQYL
ncbi:MAG: peptide-methionine (S)-S-oxide reductase MsrA, partial [Acidimicrobiia bacterium]